MTDSEKIIVLETKVEQQEKINCQMAADIKEIKDKLIGRPSWAVSITISVLLSLCVSLIILILKV